jgi:polysaccharide deacetylase family protein (PEP-CTERM system associated)
MTARASSGHNRVNALTVDVEDWFQVQALEGAVARDSWDRREARVARNTERILQLCADAGCHATFFVLGWVARRHGPLLRRIADQGHEIASHGMEHRRVDRQTPASLRGELVASKALLEHATGVAVRGYRAPSFSIGARQFWAYDSLAAAGYAYSSSVYPIRHDNYGIPDAPRHPFRPRDGNRIVELPLPTIAAGRLNLPAGGGGFFRLLPYAASRWAIARLNDAEGTSCIFYFHPWEIDPDQPRIGGLDARSRWRHYANLSRMAPRLERLLRDFSWDRLDRVYAPVLEAPGDVPLWTPRAPGRAA